MSVGQNQVQIQNSDTRKPPDLKFQNSTDRHRTVNPDRIWTALSTDKFFDFEKEYADFSNGIKAPMQVTNKYAIENNIAIEEIFQVAISQYTKNADKLAIEEEISNFLFFDTFFTNRFTGNFSNVVSLSSLVPHKQFQSGTANDLSW